MYKVLNQDSVDHFPMPINIDQWRSKLWYWSKCRSILINADHCQSMPINSDQCRSILINAALIGIDQHWSALMGNDWLLWIILRPPCWVFEAHHYVCRLVCYLKQIYVRDYADRVCPGGVPSPVQLYAQRAAWEGYHPGSLVASFGLRHRDT